MKLTDTLIASIAVTLRRLPAPQRKRILVAATRAKKTAAWDEFVDEARDVLAEQMGADRAALLRREVDEMGLSDRIREPERVRIDTTEIDRKLRARRAEAERRREADPVRRSYFPIVDYTAEGSA